MNLKKIIITVSTLMIMASRAFALDAIASVTQDGNAIVLKSEKEMLRLSILTPTMLRVQATVQPILQPALMVQAGFVKTDYPKCAYELKEDTNSVTVTTSAMKVVVTKVPFAMEIMDKASTTILKTLPTTGITLSSDHKGTQLSCEMTAVDHFFGFGFMRKCGDARGNTLICTRSYRNNEATVPFFMNPRGYAFLSDNTWKNDFDFTKPDQFTLKTAGGDMDFFVMLGSEFTDLLNQYTDLTGKPQMAPKWSLGLEHRGQYFTNQKELLGKARLFRHYNIPCDILALEPGWEEMPYSMKWVWSHTRFPDFLDTIKSIKKMGYHFDLWESGEAPKKDLLDPEVRKAWFAKREAALTNWGVDMFKQDDPYPRGIKSIQMDAAVKSDGEVSDKNRSPNELVTVGNTFYSQTAFEEWRKLTHRRPVIQFHAYNAYIASQRWPYQWAGDFGTGWGLLNASLSGHSMANGDARSRNPDGCHLDFFMSAGPVNDCWAYTSEPWNWMERQLETYRFYASLRSRLYPYLYTALHESHETGTPIMRPMVLLYPHDPETYKISTQYFLGDSLLVGTCVALDQFGDRPHAKVNQDEALKTSIRTTSVYLPQGTWVDYWTGKEFSSPTNSWVDCTFPSYAGGPLLVKEGEIIPTTQVKQYYNQRPDRLVTLEIYPSTNSMSHRLYEDDGVSFGYEEGECANTLFSSMRTSNSISMDLGKREGDYEGKPAARDYLLKVHSMLAPSKVVIDGVELSANTRKNILFSAQERGWYYDAKNNKIIIKAHSGWSFPNASKNPAGTYPLTPTEEAVNFTTDKDYSAEASHLDITISPDAKMRFGEVSQVVFESENSRILADGRSTIKVTASLCDQNGNVVDTVNQQLALHLKGGGAIPPTVEIRQGRGEFFYTAPSQAGSVKITADSPLPSQSLKLQAEEGEIKIATNPTKKVPLNGKGDFRGKDVFVIVSVRDKQGHLLTCQSSVHLNLRDFKDRETIDIPPQSLVNGEYNFHARYKTKPEKFIITATANRLKPATYRFFENAWDLPNNYLEVKDGMLPLIGK